MKKILIDISLLFLASFMFAFAHPNVLVLEGLPFLVYFSLIPVFLLVRRIHFGVSWLYGFLYGALCYAMFVHWLADFHPLGLPVIVILYGLQGMLLFPVLKMAWILCGKYGWIAQWFVWCAYDFLKTTGFSGFSYGNVAYSHWEILPLIQIVDVIGVWGLGALIVFPSAWLSVVLQPYFEKGQIDLKEARKIVNQNICSYKISGFIWVGLFLLTLTYGIFVQKDYSGNEQKTVALIQANSDPWKGGTAAYSRDLATLKRLSDEALAASDDIDFVVWSETAFVPSIRMHYRERQDRLRLDLVKDLLTFIDSKDVPFIIGNGDTYRGYNIEGEYTDLSYNSAFLFRPGENVIPPEPEIYNKMHLVPFTENFPFEDELPMIYRTLEENDTHFWDMGTEARVFTIDNVTFGTPICFEDTFGYIGRRFVQNGAQAIVNLTNDSWSHSKVAQYQHLAMAVFRSVENKIPTIRATASGQTAVIDPNGKILAMAPYFEEAYLIADFPVVEKDKKTLYTRWGDYMGYVFVVLAGLSLTIGLVCVIAKKRIK